MNDFVTLARIRFASDPLWTEFKSLTHWWPDRPQSTRRLCGACVCVCMCDGGCEAHKWVNSKSLENDFCEGAEEKIFAFRVNGEIEKMQIFWCVLRLAKCSVFFCPFSHKIKKRKEKWHWLSLTHSRVQKSLLSLIFISSLSTSCTTQREHDSFASGIGDQWIGYYFSILTFNEIPL